MRVSLEMILGVIIATVLALSYLVWTPAHIPTGDGFGRFELAAGFGGVAVGLSYIIGLFVNGSDMAYDNPLSYALENLYRDQEQWMKGMFGTLLMVVGTLLALHSTGFLHFGFTK